MRTLLVAPLLLVLSAGLVAADEPVAVAAQRAVAAFETQDEAALQRAARVTSPDPWLVLDELCRREAYAVARAFAKHAPEVRAASLAAYVDAAAAAPTPAADRTLLKSLQAAVGTNDLAEALTITKDAALPGDRVTSLRLAFGRGLALGGTRRHAEAITLLVATGEAATTMGWLTHAAAAYERAGVFGDTSGQPARALAARTAQLKIEKRLGRRDREGVTLKGLGAASEALSRYADALAYYAKALSIFQELKNRMGEAEILNNIAVVHWRQGRHADALKGYEASLAICRELESPRHVAQILANIGRVRRVLGEYRQALALYEESIEISKELKDVVAAARTLLATGTIYRRLGNYPEAMRRYRDAHAVLESIGHKPGMASATNNLGIGSAQMGRYADALRYLERARRLQAEMGDRRGVASTLQNLGSLQQLMGRFDEAHASFSKSLEIKEAIGARTALPMTLGSIAAVEVRRGEYDAAMARYGAAIEAAGKIGRRDTIASSLVGMGHVRRLQDEPGKALTLYQQARTLYESLQMPDGIALAWQQIARCHAMRKETPEAEAAIAHALKTTDQGVRLRVLMDRARLELRTERPASALATAKEALADVASLTGGLTDVEGGGTRDVFQSLYAVGCLAALRTESVGDMLHFIEHGRAASLREGLGSRAALEAVVLPDDLRREVTLARHAEARLRRSYAAAKADGKRKAIRTARKAWEGARTALDQAERQIDRAAKRGAGLTRPKTAPLEALQGALAPTDAMVFFVLTDAEGIALVVRRDGARMVKLAPSRAIEEAVDVLLDGERYIEPEHAPTVAAQLIAPLKLAADVKRVLITPTGRLGYVPFALLLPGREVALAPSGTALLALREEAGAAGSKVLGIGDPSYPTTATSSGVRVLPRLPATRIEVEAIADVHVLGDAATEAGVRKALVAEKAWRAAHFACHGLVDPEMPMMSALALTPHGGSDGSLTALDVLRMRIPADLVVLSACETGKGRIYQTEGIVGLTRAFMYAGAPRVICSLWKVDDEATRALMTRFYELWNPKQGAGITAAAALKQAQEHVKAQAKWAHPYYWSAWTLWGLPE